MPRSTHHSLHNVKDKHWNEDKQYCIREALGCIQSSIRSLALNALRVVEIPEQPKKTSLSKKALNLLAQPLKALALLNKI